MKANEPHEYGTIRELHIGVYIRMHPVSSCLNDQIEEAVNLLSSGGVVAVPTDTLYGLAASGLNDSAVERVFQIKRRSLDMAIPLLLADIEQLDTYCIDIPEVAYTIVHHFWPGGLTIILKKSPEIPSIVSAGGNTIAVRIPDHEVPRAISRKLEAPITGTSANISGHPELATSDEVVSSIGDKIDMVVRSKSTRGHTPLGVGSTILNLASEVPKILRTGAVAKKDIEVVCGYPIANAEGLS